MYAKAKCKCTIAAMAAALLQQQQKQQRKSSDFPAADLGCVFVSEMLSKLDLLPTTQLIPKQICNECVGLKYGSGDHKGRGDTA